MSQLEAQDPNALASQGWKRQLSELAPLRDGLYQ